MTKEWVKHTIASLTLLFIVSVLTINADGNSISQPPPSSVNAGPVPVSRALWHDLRKSFELRHATREPTVTKQIHWYQTHQIYLDKILSKAAPYLYFVYTQVQARHLPGELALLPLIESDYDPFAYSDRGAAGLWQLMPGTAQGYGIKLDWWYDGRRDIYASTKAALDYLEYLHTFFDNNWYLAISAYDSGAGTIQHAIDKNTKLHKKTDFWSLPLPKETKAYLPRLLALAAIIADPSYYGLQLPAIKNGPYFAMVDVGSQISLATAAKLAGISLQKLYHLNPGYNRWATDPNGPSRLLLPVANIQTFKKNLAKLPKDKRIIWHRYTVKPGDSLSRIAHHFKTCIILIKKINKLSSNILHPGKRLLIPANAQKNKRHFNLTPEIRYATKQQLRMTPKKTLHTVRSGDSLWKIAHEYGVNEINVRHWNHLKKNQVLPVGKKLTLWLPRHTRIPKKIKGKKDYANDIYIVESGDSLSTIAMRFQVTLKKLKAVNDLTHNVIRVGEKLKIPN